ncbi:MAG: hypothetical protein ACXAD7_23630 [Candidatus Kariarchaeaceae archaeon]
MAEKKLIMIDKEYKEILERLKATRYTTRENVISLFIVVITLFFHLVFTMALHILPES